MHFCAEVLAQRTILQRRAALCLVAAKGLFVGGGGGQRQVLPKHPDASPGSGERTKVLSELGHDDTALAQIDGCVLFVHLRQITAALGQVEH